MNRLFRLPEPSAGGDLDVEPEDGYFAGLRGKPTAFGARLLPDLWRCRAARPWLYGHRQRDRPQSGVAERSGSVFLFWQPQPARRTGTLCPTRTAFPAV